MHEINEFTKLGILIMIDQIFKIDYCNKIYPATHGLQSFENDDMWH